FPAVKKRIDEGRRNRIDTPGAGLEPGSFRLTGSNLTEVNRSVRETLAGRVNILYLHGLSWNEAIRFAPETSLGEYAFRGGFPELWIRREINPIDYLNDYISTFIEKDLAGTIGIEKRNSFLQVLRLLAARVG